MLRLHRNQKSYFTNLVKSKLFKSYRLNGKFFRLPSAIALSLVDGYRKNSIPTETYHFLCVYSDYVSNINISFRLFDDSVDASVPFLYFFELDRKNKSIELIFYFTKECHFDVEFLMSFTWYVLLVIWGELTGYRLDIIQIVRLCKQPKKMRRLIKLLESLFVQEQIAFLFIRHLEDILHSSYLKMDRKLFDEEKDTINIDKSAFLEASGFSSLDWELMICNRFEWTKEKFEKIIPLTSFDLEDIDFLMRLYTLHSGDINKFLSVQREVEDILASINDLNKII